MIIDLAQFLVISTFTGVLLRNLESAKKFTKGAVFINIKR